MPQLLCVVREKQPRKSNSVVRSKNPASKGERKLFHIQWDELCSGLRGRRSACSSLKHYVLIYTPLCSTSSGFPARHTVLSKTKRQRKIDVTVVFFLYVRTEALYSVHSLPGKYSTVPGTYHL
jgi:hypothetical protein